MIDIPRSERKTQNRVIDLFTSTTGADALGYRYLGEGNKREANRPIETELLRADLAARGYTAAQIHRHHAVPGQPEDIPAAALRCAGANCNRAGA